jgi:subtilisin family serine protease
VINLSLGGEEVSQLERRALDYAAEHDVLVVVAEGNTSQNATDWGFGALSNVIAVAATDPADRRADFSNWGRDVGLAAPGVDVLSLRARGTDLLASSDAVGYAVGSAAVGPDALYLRASGTSFAAAFVSGVASLLRARDPALGAEQVRRLLLHSARDLDPPGVDQLTGYGLLDARAALSSEPRFFVEAAIDRVEVAEDGDGTRLAVYGTTDADSFDGATVELAPADSVSNFAVPPQRVGRPVRDGLLATVDPSRLRASQRWVLRLVTYHTDGRWREARYVLGLEAP